jgi:hypothetical protein
MDVLIIDGIEKLDANQFPAARNTSALGRRTL